MSEQPENAEKAVTDLDLKRWELLKKLKEAESVQRQAALTSPENVDRAVEAAYSLNIETLGRYPTLRDRVLAALEAVSE